MTAMTTKTTANNDDNVENGNVVVDGLSLEDVIVRVGIMTTMGYIGLELGLD